MKLAKLCAAAGFACEADANVTGFAIDNRKVAPGTVFGAFQGTQINGEDFIAAAIESGAIAVVARPEAAVEGAGHIADFIFALLTYDVDIVVARGELIHLVSHVFDR